MMRDVYVIGALITYVWAVVASFAQKNMTAMTAITGFVTALLWPFFWGMIMAIWIREKML